MATRSRAPARPLVFGRFRIDPVRGDLADGGRTIPLRRRSWDLLCVLVSHPGELLSKEELLARVWSDAVVSEQTLATSIAEIRRALGDDPKRPRFLETVRGRGFRFIADVKEADLPVDADGAPTGRGATLLELTRWWDRAAAGQRQVGFVVGDVGIGKTTVLRALARRCEQAGAPLAVGQCIDHHGVCEPYMPLLDAIARLARARDTAAGRLLEAHAPPWLLRGQDADAAGGPARAETRASTLRRLAELVERLAAERPLVIVLEDLHWSDPSTVDLVSALAQRRERARLLVVGSFRPADAGAADHPVVPVARELVRKGLAHRITLEGLGAEDIARVLQARLGQGEVPVSVAQWLARQTAGNPFLLRELISHLDESGALELRDGVWALGDAAEHAGLPEGVIAALEPRFALLPTAEQRVLEAAAVLGIPFSGDLLSQLLDGEIDVDDADDLCQRIAAERDVLVPAEDGAYGFRHALYERAFQERVAAGRRRRLHRAAARALASTGAAGPALIASHHARGAEPERAVARYGEAVAVAKARFADREVVQLCEAALAQAALLPDEEARKRAELALLLELCVARFSVEGYGRRAQVEAFERAFALADALGERELGVLGAAGLFMTRMSGGDVPGGRDAAALSLALSEELAPPFRRLARTALGVALFNEGRLADALSCLELAQGEMPEHAEVGFDLEIFRLAGLAKTQAHLGRRAAATATIAGAAAQGTVSGRPFDRTNAHRMAAELHAILGDVDAARAHAQESAALAEHYGYPQLGAIAAIFAGWATARSGEPARGLREIDDGLAALAPTGYRLTMSGFRVRQAEAAIAAGDASAATRAVGSGLGYAAGSGELRHLADLHRLRGDALQLAHGPSDEARGAYEEAISHAAQQGAPLLELRATLRLAELDATGNLRRRLRDLLANHPAALSEAERADAEHVLADPDAATPRG